MIKSYFKNPNFLRRNIIAAAIVPIIMLALYNWFVSPQIQYIKASQKFKDSADRVAKTYQSISSQIQTGAKKCQEVSQQFEREKEEFFDADSARVYLGGIGAKAEKNRCSVDNLKFLPAKQVTNKTDSVDIQQYQAILTVTGQYPNIIKLLDSLQNGGASGEKVWIDNISLHLKDQTSGLLVCDMSLSLYTLRVKEIIRNVSNKK